MLTGNDLKRLAGNMAGKIILRNAPWESQRCRRKKNRLDSADDRDGTGLLLRPILLGNQPCLLAGGDINAHQRRLLDLHPCSAKVDPASFRIFCDDGVLGADVLSAVIFVNLGRWKTEDVNIFASLDVFCDRSRSDPLRRNGLVVIHPLADCVNQSGPS